MILTILSHVSMQRLLRAATLSASLALLAACGGGGGDAAPASDGSLSLTGPARAIANTRYSYQASPADASGISWNWGDGTPDSSGARAQKVWHKPGSFTATVQALVNGQTASASQAVQVTGAPLGIGQTHVCVLQPDASVRCWGNNSEGELGNDSTVDSTPTVAVTGVSDAVDVAVGGAHSCALQAKGSVRCWGFNAYGQVGNGSTSTAVISPITVSGLSDGVALSAGYSHMCVLQSGGTVRCWGNNKYNQLGNSSTVDSSTSVPVTGVKDAIALTTGGQGLHTCALQASGSVRCWGWNFSGQLGDGGTTDRGTSVAVSGMNDAVALAAGYAHTCALQPTGSVRCWGRNASGQLGNGGNIADSTSPVVVTGLSDAIAVATGSSHTCALQASGSVRCWGNNTDGQLGNGSTTASNTSVAVTGLTDAVALSAGYSYSCALQASGNVRCWGKLPQDLP
jgi:alpha-tubulin suppressor-like RCC1 family protein